MSKIKQLSMLLILLVCLSVGLQWFGSRELTQAFDNAQFAVTDTTAVRSISIVYKGDQIDIERSSNAWMLDGAKKVDPSLIAVFNAIMSQVTVLRPISPLNFEEIKSDLVTQGRRVKLETTSGNSTFYVGGNGQKTQSYFATDDLSEIYLVGIPGYNHYLSGIFELTKGQWRSRTLFNSNWRTMQSFDLNYLSDSDADISIKFDGTSFNVNGLRADSLITINYVNQFENFQLNDYLEEGIYPSYDSLKETIPLAELTLIDINNDLNRSFLIYPKMKGEQFYLLVSNDGDMIVLDEKRVKKILKKPFEFQVR